MNEKLLDRYHGALVGLAIGDAMGMPIEFHPPNTFEKVTGFRNGGVFGLKAGYWTDDTSQALCLAHSLINKKGFDPLDVMKTFKRWWSEEAFLSSMNEAFGLGRTTGDAFRRFDYDGNPYAGRPDEFSSGNGCIMRLAPVPLFYVSDPVLAMNVSINSSRLTHGSNQCLDACRMLSSLIIGALRDVPKDLLLNPYYSPISEDYWENNPVHKKIDNLLRGEYKNKEPAIYQDGMYMPDPIKTIKGTGYVVNTLEAALWSFYTSDSFDEGLLKVVNLGNDADTTGAVYGQLAGAYYGENAISKEWRAIVAHYGLIVKYADEIYKYRYQK